MDVNKPKRGPDANFAALAKFGSVPLLPRGSRRALLPLVVQTSDAAFVRVRDPRQTVDAFHHLPNQNLVLVMRLFVPLLHARNQLHGLCQCLMAFSQLIEALIDVHLRNLLTTSISKPEFSSRTFPALANAAAPDLDVSVRWIVTDFSTYERYPRELISVCRLPSSSTIELKSGGVPNNIFCMAR